MPAEVRLVLAFNYARLVKSLLTDNTIWAKHVAAIAADPAQQQALVGVLLGCCLPTVAATAAAGQQKLSSHGSDLLIDLSATLQHSSLAPAVRHQLQTGGAEAAFEHAAAILHAQPTSRPSGMTGPEWIDLLASGTALMVFLSRETAQFSQQSVTTDLGETAQAASDTAAVAAAGWQAARLLPHLAASVAALAADVQDRAAFPAGTTAWLDNANLLCFCLQYLQEQVYALSVGQCSAQQLFCWLDAVSASLRLASCLAPLAAHLELASDSVNGATLLS